MNTSLRQAHFGIWLGIAILVVPLSILALTGDEAIPKINKILPVQEQLDHIVIAAENDWVLATVRTDSNIFQLELILHKPLEVPSAVLRYVNNSGEYENLGLIQNSGLSRYSLNEKPTKLEIYDFIKKTIITELTF